MSRCSIAACRTTPKLLGPGWRQLTVNVAGVFFCQVLGEHYNLSDYREAACGWSGDRYCVLENNKGRLALLWISYWDTARDAAEFSMAYTKILRLMFPQRQWRKMADGLTSSVDGHTTYLNRSNRQVILFQGVPDSSLPDLQRQFQKIIFFACERK